MINNPVIVAQDHNLEAASTLETSASGRIPVYDHGYATSELASDTFETSATGEIVS